MFQPWCMYTTGQAMIQYFNLYCLYKTFIFKLYNGIIEIHRIIYRVYFSVLTVKITHLLRQVFFMSKLFKYMHFFLLQYYVTLKSKISIVYSLFLTRSFSFRFSWIAQGAHCCETVYKNHESTLTGRFPIFVCIHVQCTQLVVQFSKCLLRKYSDIQCIHQFSPLGLLG